VSAALALTLASVAEAAPEAVTFPGDGVTVSAVLYRPAGPGPFPAVVALHGCGGLNDPGGSLNARHADWGERLAAQGFVVLLPDSFGSRGLGPQCRVTERTVRPGIHRVQDALASKAYLQTRPDVKPDAVSLMGWSHGGGSVLFTVQPRNRGDVARPDFARAVAFYPGCHQLAESGHWRTRVPLLLLMGDADDWTPPEPCRALVDAAKARGEPVESVFYPGAVHGFDHPSQPPRTRRGLAYTADGSGTARVGTDPAARADVLDRVPRFLVR
jgi:dienelactone hydrolase